MQNYMANQSFNRGKDTYQATASMAFVGNTKHTVPYMLKNSHLFESIPDGYIKGAFLDRMHMYIPGWEVRILKSSVFTKDYGFIVDYLAEILKELRKADYSGLMDRFIELDGSLTTRDKTAVRKSFSGLAKLIYPNKEMNEAQVLELLDFAIEGRKRVKDQLYIIDETFRSERVSFKYRIKSSGVEVEPETLEKLNYHTQQKAIKGSENPVASSSKGAESEEPTKPLVDLKPHQVSLKDNQTEISYQILFGDYLRGATKIQLQDPYIRMYYQFKNLLEFCLMLSQEKSPEDEIDLHVISNNNPEHLEDSRANFEDLQESVADLGIHLTYEFADVHDRSIISDNGWKINLGRGLDIFDRIEGKFSAADLDQTKRKCKACDITYLRV
jgi:ATP-dependent Lon protease